MDSSNKKPLFDFNKKNKIILKKTFSNRRESIHWENKLNDSIDQWEEIKKDHEVKIEKQLLEEELRRREEEVKIEKKKIFNEIMAEKEMIEEETFKRREDIDQKIRDRKRYEMKKRDVAHRNKNPLG